MGVSCSNESKEFSISTLSTSTMCDVEMSFGPSTLANDLYSADVSYRGKKGYALVKFPVLPTDNIELILLEGMLISNLTRLTFSLVWKDNLDNMRATFNFTGDASSVKNVSYKGEYYQSSIEDIDITNEIVYTQYVGNIKAVVHVGVSDSISATHTFNINDGSIIFTVEVFSGKNTIDMISITPPDMEYFLGIVRGKMKEVQISYVGLYVDFSFYGNRMNIGDNNGIPISAPSQIECFNPCSYPCIDAEIITSSPIRDVEKVTYYIRDGCYHKYLKGKYEYESNIITNGTVITIDRPYVSSTIVPSALENTEFTMKLDAGTMFLVLSYAMLKMILARLVTGIYNIEWLYRSNYSLLYNTIKKSRYKNMIPLIDEYSYLEVHFMYNACS